MNEYLQNPYDVLWIVPLVSVGLVLLYIVVRQYIWPYEGEETQIQVTPRGAPQDDPWQYSKQKESTWLYEKIEERCNDEKLHIAYVLRRDPLFFLLVCGPALTAVAFAILALYAGRSPEIPGAVSYLVASGCSAIATIVFWKFLFRQASPDVLLVRFLFVSVMFRNCLVFHVPRFTSMPPIPGSQNVLETPRSGDNRIIVQLGQGAPPPTMDIGDPPITMQTKDVPYDQRPPISSGDTDEQLVVLKIVYHLAIWRLPLTLVKAFYQEFVQRNGETMAHAMVRAFANLVKPQVLEVITGRADSVLQHYYVEELLTQVDRVNDALMHTFGRELWAIGVMLDQISVEHVDDVRPNGFVAKRSEGKRSERDREARIRASHAKREADIVEYENRKLVAVASIAALKKQREAATWKAKTELEPLRLELELLAQDNSQAAMILRKLNQVPEEGMPELVAALRRVYKPGGNLFVMEGGGQNSPTDEVLGKLAAIVQSSIPTNPKPPAASAGSNP